jgi:hypothetical protein
MKLPSPPLQTNAVLAYARNHAAERQGRWADGAKTLPDTLRASIGPKEMNDEHH